MSKSKYQKLHDYIMTTEYAETQQMIDSGLAWKLEGSYGRHAHECLRVGVCILGAERQTNYYGGIVPSYKDVKQGTIGSVDYVAVGLEYLTKA